MRTDIKVIIPDPRYEGLDRFVCGWADLAECLDRLLLLWDTLARIQRVKREERAVRAAEILPKGSILVKFVIAGIHRLRKRSEKRPLS